MSSLTLPYGRGELAFELDHSYSVHTPKLPITAPDAANVVSDALDRPISSPPLAEIVRPGEKVLLVASDITRPVPYDVVLPPLLFRLLQAGVSAGHITLIFANGTHRLMTREDARIILGDELEASLRWVNHDAKDSENLVYLGKTGRNTPVWVNRRAVEADRVILTGAVVHHYFAGFGGGRKCLVPGIAGMATALANHRLVLGKSCRGLDSACRPGNLTDNPVHEDIMEACRMLPPDFLLNVVLDPGHQVLHATAGHWHEAHLAACRLADEIYSVPLDEPAQLVIASCGGFPKDINFIQSHKTFDNVFPAVSPGNVLILFAECTQGVGSADFLSWYEHTCPQSMGKALSAAYSIHGHTALTAKSKAAAVRVILVSSLEPALVDKLGMIPATSAEDALKKAYTLLATTAPKTYIFPCGSLTVPTISPHK
ncbi:MAG: nickel-dependent lactate racemase [Bacillota bacterium]|nr:nickel-dependent lactate racemase [Bacillota bacterium]MDW7683436.1 nickel-dependent lactate racemase [Bacillota bacterium]